MSFAESSKETRLEITELKSEAEFMEAFSIIRELHRDLTEERSAELLTEMRREATACSPLGRVAGSWPSPASGRSRTYTTDATSSYTIS